MASVVKIKRSSIKGKRPSVEQLELGELALNTSDGKLYSSTGNQIFEIGANTEVARIGTLTVGNTSPFTLPTSDGANGQVLKTNGEGTVFWADDETANNVAYAEFVFTANSGQVTFTGTDINNRSLSYEPDSVAVYLNGVKLKKDTDFFANNGTTVVLDDSTFENDTVEIISYTKKVNFVSVEADIISLQKIHTTNSSEVVDSWGIGEYRSAKYIVQSEDVDRNDSFQVSEVLLVHSDSSVQISETNIANTSARVAQVSADISGGSVRLIVTPTNNQNLKTKISRLTLNK